MQPKIRDLCTYRIEKAQNDLTAASQKMRPGNSLSDTLLTWLRFQFKIFGRENSQVR